MLKRILPIGIVGVGIALFFGALFGIAGVRLVLGFVVLCWMPFYLLFDRAFRIPESAFLSFFLSLPAYASLTYGLGFLISFKLSLLVVAAAIYGLSFIPWRKNA